MSFLRYININQSKIEPSYDTHYKQRLNSVHVQTFNSGCPDKKYNPPLTKINKNLKAEDIMKSLKRLLRKQCKKYIEQELLSLDDFVSLNPFPEILSLTLLEIALHSRDLDCIEIDGARVIKDGSTSTNGKYVFKMIEKCISNLNKLPLDNTIKEEITLLRFQLLYKLTNGKHITRYSQTKVELEKSERMNREISRPLHAFSTTFVQHSELNREFCIILKDIWNEY